MLRITKQHIKLSWKAALLVILLTFPVIGSAQNSMNMNLLGNWDDNGLPVLNGASYNDVWGYAANGREYGIIGTVAGLYIIDVTVPTSPTVVTFQAGGASSATWRDFKTYQNYLYAVSDNASGSTLQIFNLNGLPASVTKVYDSAVLFDEAHNIVVEGGRMYVAGTDVQANGILIYDIATDPASPTLLADYLLGGYVHDIYVKNDTCYAYFGNGGVASFNFVSLVYPSAIASITSYVEAGYAHSGAATADFKTMFWCDETNDTGIHTADISNPLNINVTGVFRSTLLAPTHTNSISHNPFIKDSLLYVSYYHDGIQVWDISNPNLPVKAAYYDTFPSNSDYTGSGGCWGVYPYLPSGNILASDMQNGLFILQESGLFPVELSHFTAEPVEKVVQIKWRTQTETNNEHFVLERSADGLNFELIAKVAGALNSKHELKYEITDAQPLDGKSYYRLVQNDLDGKETHSDILAVNRGDEFRLLAVYPSPSQSGERIEAKLFLDQASFLHIRVTDVTGRVIELSKHDLPAGLNTISLQNEKWASGTYFVKFSKGNQSMVQKIMVHK